MRIGYDRVSTVDQNLDLQIDALNAAGCDEIYEDEGLSGVRAKRPGLEKALARLKQDDVLVVWKLDRLGRSMKHLIELTSALESRGVGFHSLSDAIDTSTPGGKLYFHLMGAFAEFERNLISERTKAGMAAAKARGVKMGRPKKLAPQQREAVARFDSDVLDDAARQIGAHSSTVHCSFNRTKPT
ncbi:MAG: recombinase family protein [Parvularculaceae bacterium]